MRLCSWLSLRLRINRLRNGGRALFTAGIICRGSMGPAMMGSAMMITCGIGGAKKGVGFHAVGWEVASSISHPFVFRVSTFEAAAAAVVCLRMRNRDGDR